MQRGKILASAMELCFCEATSGSRTERASLLYVVESRRLGSGSWRSASVVSGEINDKSASAWRKTLDVFDEQQCRIRL